MCNGLKMCLMKPKDLLGAAPFDRMIKFRMRRFDRNKGKPSDYLNVYFTDNHPSITQPTEKELTTKSIIESAGGDGTRIKIPKRKLDNLGCI